MFVGTSHWYMHSLALYLGYRMANLIQIQISAITS